MLGDEGPHRRRILSAELAKRPGTEGLDHHVVAVGDKPPADRQRAPRRRGRLIGPVSATVLTRAARRSQRSGDAAHSSTRRSLIRPRTRASRRACGRRIDAVEVEADRDSAIARSSSAANAAGWKRISS